MALFRYRFLFAFLSLAAFAYVLLDHSLLQHPLEVSASVVIRQAFNATATSSVQLPAVSRGKLHRNGILHGREDNPAIAKSSEPSPSDKAETAAGMLHATTRPASWLPEGEKASIYWMHVGKCAGITFKAGLPVSDAKEEAMPCLVRSDPSIPLETAMQRCYHPNWTLYHTNTLLYSIRSPISRFVSAFNYHMNVKSKWTDEQERIFHQCYANVEEVAQAVVHNRHYSYTCPQAISKTCTNLFAKLLNNPGTRRVLPHFWYNFQHYARYIHKAASHVVVVRSEHLWEDAMNLDRALGGDGVFGHAGLHHTHGSETWHAKKQLTQEASRSLCCVLYKDIEAYQEIVLRAENLSDDEKEETMRLAFDECGIETVDANAPFSWQQWHARTCAITGAST